MAYIGEPCLEVRKDSYTKARLQSQADKREAKKPSLGFRQHQPGDRILSWEGPDMVPVVSLIPQPAK